MSAGEWKNPYPSSGICRCGADEGWLCVCRKRRGGDPCDHVAASPVFNSKGVPVRLLCSCGEEWRVVPVDARVTLRTEAT